MLCKATIVIITLTGSQFRDNRARLGGVFVTYRSIVTFEDCRVSGNIGRDGGAINAIQTHIIFRGSCYLTNNMALTGAAVQAASGSTLDVYNTLVIASNKAKFTAGGIFLYQGRLNCHYNCTLTFLQNEARKCGGGIHAIRTIVTIHANTCRTSPDKSSII